MLLAISIFWAAVLLWLMKTDAKAQVLKFKLDDSHQSMEWHILAPKSYIHKRIGLLNHLTLAPRTGLLLCGVKQVHTKSMVFPIDIVFLDKEMKILGTIPLAPGERNKDFPKSTANILEVAAGQGSFFTVGSALKAC
jgi:uncharacterized membrane protein (UPF0127 family)